VKPFEYISALRTVKFPNVFNPYSDRCAVCDLEDAPLRRRKTILAMLESATSNEVDAIWVGRDLGYRGGRRTGLALTDDVHLPHHASRWNVYADRPTTGGLVRERTAAVIWTVLGLIRVPIFLWNVFPLHPHHPEAPFTNRAHNADERKIGEDFLASLVDLLRPRRVVAIGNDAAKTCVRLMGAQKVITARHPSYGGQAVFVRQIRTLYGLLESSDGRPSIIGKLHQ
jgi:uracil-DNA glycosylase